VRRTLKSRCTCAACRAQLLDLWQMFTGGVTCHRVPFQCLSRISGLHCGLASAVWWPDDSSVRRAAGRGLVGGCQKFPVPGARRGRIMPARHLGRNRARLSAGPQYCFMAVGVILGAVGCRPVWSSGAEGSGLAPNRKGWL
jgi:hypothetical protein